jgi:hypothetical protein
VRRLLPALLAVPLFAGCGSAKHAAAPRYDQAELTRCLRAGADSFAREGGVVRLNVYGEKRFGTLAEVDVAFGRTTSAALARLRTHYFFRRNAKAKPFVHGRYLGNVAYAITTLPFLKKGPRGLSAARERVRLRAKRLVEGCLARSRG